MKSFLEKTNHDTLCYLENFMLIISYLMHEADIKVKLSRFFPFLDTCIYKLRNKHLGKLGSF